MFVLVFVGLSATARADDFELPPDPRGQPPTLAGEVHLDLVFPTLDSPLCPPDAACVFGNGGGIGGRIERRWHAGLALGLGLDLWFLDAGGVFELAVMEALEIHVRYQFLKASTVHPVLAVSGGGVFFGDTFRVDTVGFSFAAAAGIEVEISPSLAFSTSLLWRFFRTTSFTSANDEVERAARRGLNGAVALQVGLVLLQSPN